MEGVCKMDKYSELETKCSECGKKIGIGMYSLISDMCDDCYEKEKFYKIQNKYNKEYITQRLNPYSGDKLVQIIDAEIKVNEKIKKIARERKMMYACIFCEFDKDKILTLDELDYSYFLSNDKCNLISKFEDRKKEKNFLVCN